MNPFPYIWAAFGLIFGSFLNVCIYRLPRRESIVFPGSHCPKCGKPVRPFDNIPVLSYLVLAGKCRSCRTSISLQYPVVEALAGGAFLACALRWDVAPPTFVNSILLAVIIALVFIDYHHQILPNILTLPGLILGITLSPLQAPAYFQDPLSREIASLLSADPERFLPWAGSALGALLGGGLLYVVAALYQLLRKRQGLGMGDVKMMAMVGAFLGWPIALLTIFAGSFLGSLVGIALVLFGGRTLQTKLAFGTFLGAAAAASLFCGLPIIRWYSGG
jgi:leader peptidase (prepilin peptidase)/N-methyltransferase